jgi:tetratricopeptide (TPR) repeat protein
MRAEEIRDVARSRGEHLPPELEKEIDWDRASDRWIGFRAAEGNPTPMSDRIPAKQRPLVGAYGALLAGRLPEIMRAWSELGREPEGATEIALVAAGLADMGDEAALAYIERLRALEPTEAATLLGRLRFRQGKYVEAAQALDEAFRAYQTDVWAWPILMNHALETAGQVMNRDAAAQKVVRGALEKPFAAMMLDETRREMLLKMTVAREPDASCSAALASYEPNTLWQEPLLTWRARCYDMLHHADAARAAQERDEFASNEPTGMSDTSRVVRSPR